MYKRSYRRRRARFLLSLRYISRKAVINTLALAGVLGIASFFIWKIYAATSIPVVTTSSTTNATATSTMKNIVQTSDGTLHSFIQVGTEVISCGGSNVSGLLWYMSTNGGASWTCQGQLHSDTTNIENASAAVDPSNNIYVAYARTTTQGQSGFDIHYRKLIKGIGSSWTMGSQQIAIAGSSTAGYNTVTLALEGTNRIWVAARTQNSNGLNYISIFYSSDLSSNPTWSVSKAQQGTASTAGARHLPLLVRYGSKMGIFSKSDISGAGIEWSTRSDSDDPTNWTAPNQVLSGANQDGAFFSATGDSNGNVYLASNDSANSVRFTYFNGSHWSNAVNIGTSAVNAVFSSISTDGYNVWIFYPDATNLSGTLPGSRRIAYKKGIPPYTSADFDTNATPVVNYHGVFDKYWSFVSSAYTNDTTDAGNTTASDTQMVTAIGDIAYFGKTTKFDSLSWALSTNGVGGVIAWEYWNGSAWTALSFTSSSNTNFQGSGYGSFTDPADWATTAVNGEGSQYYYIRARTTTAFTTTPVGLQMAAIPPILWAGFTSSPSSNTIYGLWTENSLAQVKVRASSVTVSSTTPNGAAGVNIKPNVIGYSDVAGSTYPSQTRRIVRTSDGVLHAFVTGGAVTNTCGGSTSINNTYGLNWVYSTDFGTSWICGGQLSSDQTNIMRASVITDSSDNIYVAYGTNSAIGSTANDIFYRKLTKGEGDTWTIGAAQTALDATSASEGYSYPSLETDGTRIWLIARRFVASNQFTPVAYYSDGFSSSPTWTVSSNALDTAGNSSSAGGNPTTIRFGTKIGLIWRTSASNRFDWRYRDDSDPLTTWSTQSMALNDNSQNESLSATSDNAGNIILGHINSSGALMTTVYNGTSWSSSFNLTTNTAAGNPSFTTDGTNVYATYLDTTGLNTGLTGNRRLVYKKGVAPFASGNFDTNPTQLVSSHGTFDKYWSYFSSAYTNDTTDAADTDTTNTASSGSGSDVQMVGSVGDNIYFGKSEKFDGVEFDVATAGVGGVIAWEYWNGSAWVALNKFVRAANDQLNGDGYISFIPNTDWATTTVNGEGTPYYYIRARVVTAFTTNPIGVQMASIPGLLADPDFTAMTMAGSRLVGIYNDGGSQTLRMRFTAGTADTTAPTSNASSLAMKRSTSGTTVSSNGWTNNLAPYFSWTAGADDTNGVGLKGYCAYLGTDPNGDPSTSKGLLGTSPVSTNGTTCQFIASGTNIDFATTSLRGSPWLTSATSSYYLNLKAVDSAGNIVASSAQFQFRFDNTAPTNVSFISCASGSFANVVDMNFSWPTSGGTTSTDSDSGVLGWQYQINSSSGTWLGSTTESVLGISSYIPNTDSNRTLTQNQDESFIDTGVNIIYFRTVDAAGNASSTNTIRSCNLAFGGDAANFGGTDVVKISPSSSAENKFSLSWPDATPASGRTINHYYYMINTQPPASLATLQSNAATYIDNKKETSVSADALPNINKGSNTVYVVAVDDADNYSPSNSISGSFTLNSTDPDNPTDLVASDSSIKAQQKWNVTLTWVEPVYKGAGNLTYLIYRSSDAQTFTQVGSTSGQSFVDTAPTSSKYYYKVYSKDGANAQSSGTNAVDITPTGKWTTPPTLTDGPIAGAITTKKATITWSTSRTADSKVAFGTSPGSYKTEEPSNSNQVSSHTITLSGLSPGTTYYYKAKWTDEDGNSDASAEKSFTTAPAPSIKDAAATSVGLANGFIQFTSTSASKVKIYYGTSTGFGGLVEVSTSTSESTYSTELSGLTDGTKYYYKINAVDSEGSEYEGTILDFTTFPRPRINNVKLQEVRGTAQPTMLVSWTSNTEISSIATYYPEGQVSKTRDEVNIALKKGAHSLKITGLFPQTRYVLVVKGRDKLGNEAISDPQTFTTATDTRPPAILNVKIEGTTIPAVGGAGQEVKAQLVISWDTDEPSSSQVEYGEGTGDTYSQKTQQDTNLTTNHLVVISGLTPSKVYHLRALSRDKAGNDGVSIDSVTITPKSTDSALNLVVGNLTEIFGFLIK